MERENVISPAKLRNLLETRAYEAAQELKSRRKIWQGVEKTLCQMLYREPAPLTHRFLWLRYHHNLPQEVLELGFTVAYFGLDYDWELAEKWLLDYTLISANSFDTVTCNPVDMRIIKWNKEAAGYVEKWEQILLENSRELAKNLARLAAMERYIGIISDMREHQRSRKDRESNKQYGREHPWLLGGASFVNALALSKGLNPQKINYAEWLVNIFWAGDLNG